MSAGPQTKANGNFVEGQAIANLSVVPVDADGDFCVFNFAAVNVVVDLQGYWSSATGGLGLAPVAPTRKLDTRTSTPRVAAGTITRVETDAPVGSSAVLANIAMADGLAPGYITADPMLRPRERTANESERQPCRRSGDREPLGRADRP